VQSSKIAFSSGGIAMKKFNLLKFQALRTYTSWFQFLLVGYASIFAVGQIFYGSIGFSAVCGLSVILLTEQYKKYLDTKRTRLLRNQFGDLLYSLSASVATGRQLSSALQEAYLNMGYVYKDNTPMMIELKYMVKSIAENQESEETILSGFAQRSGVEDIRNFVSVYLTCRSTGSDINQVILNASEILLQKMSIEREIRVMTSQKQFEGKIISAMPVVIILFLNITSPGYLENLYCTVMGRLVMTVALAGILTAYVLTEKIMNIEG
jgi:tight adherence protein B